jgi:glycosyltransferase involved in cell wall biosynthesis
MTPLTVVFLTRALVFGGAERQLVGLAVGLHRRGHRVMVLTYYDDGPLAPALAEAGVPHRSLGKRSRWDLLGPAWRAFRMVRARKPDVLHGYLVDANIAVSILRLARPRARVVAGIRGTLVDFSRYPLLIRLTFRAGVWFARASHLIISNSQSGAAQHVAAGYPEGRMRVIPNGIDTTVFRPDPSRRAAWRDAWGFGPADRLIGVIGRLAPMKDHPTFLRAAALLAASRPDVRFVCVGEGPVKYRTELQELARGLGLAHLLRWESAQTDVLGVYNALDLVTSSSASGEGFSNVIGEAMATGTLCVATDVGDARLIVGGAGIVVAPRDPAALADGLRRGLSLLESPERPDPRRRIEENFSVDRLVLTTEAVLAGLLISEGTADS